MFDYDVHQIPGGVGRDFVKAQVRLQPQPYPKRGAA